MERTALLVATPGPVVFIMSPDLHVRSSNTAARPTSGAIPQASRARSNRMRNCLGPSISGAASAVRATTSRRQRRTMAALALGHRSRQAAR